MSDPITVIQKAEAHSQAYDTFLDGFAQLIGHDSRIWDHDSMLTGYMRAIAEFWIAGVLRTDEYVELMDLIHEMTFGFEPSGTDAPEAA